MYYNSIGQLLEKERTKKGLTQAVICKGLCNVSTYNRYERDEILPDKFMLDYLLERLGKNPDTINYLMSSNEIALRELQLKIDKSLTSAPDTEQLLKEFKQIAKKRNANIHNQFR